MLCKSSVVCRFRVVSCPAGSWNHDAEGCSREYALNTFASGRNCDGSAKYHQLSGSESDPAIGSLDPGGVISSLCDVMFAKSSSGVMLRALDPSSIFPNLGASTGHSNLIELFVNRAAMYDHFCTWSTGRLNCSFQRHPALRESSCRARFFPQQLRRHRFGVRNRRIHRLALSRAFGVNSHTHPHVDS